MKIITDKPTYCIDEKLDIKQANWDAPHHLGLGQISMEKLFRTVALEPKLTSALTYSDTQLNLNELVINDPLMSNRTISGEQLLNRRVFNDSLLVMHKGEVIHESYRNGMMAEDKHVIHSCTKSLCAMLVAMAVDEKRIEVDQAVSFYLPKLNSIPAWKGVTVQQVLNMQAGIKYSEDYTDPHADYWSYARAAGYYPALDDKKAIGAKAWIYQNLTIRSDEPGTAFVYNSCLANVLGMILEEVYQQDLALIFEQKLYQPCGVESEAFFNTDPQGFPITEGQFNCRLRDFARLAYPIINQGRTLSGEQLIPESFISELVEENAELQAAYQKKNQDPLFPQGMYKNQFWIFEPVKKQFSMLGIHGQFAWFDLNQDLMVVGQGSFPVQDGDLKMKSLNCLWQAVADLIN